jgi:photosystem II stability/assembly factor-like uncharacterized protein
MSKHLDAWSRPLAGILLVLVVAGLLAISGPTRAEEISRAQQIADLERQIQELTKKLDELRREAATTPKPQEGLPASWVKALHWRSIGPASMGGRITALSVYEADPTTFWVATASGGLLKTVNNGVTFEHQFDREATVSIGEVCVAPSDPRIVWVGTGEANPRNSVSYGDGVYKSTDGGKTWHNMGLTKSFQIGRIAVHPKNPDIVYVGALGRLYGPSPERGLFKTTDGGKTWEKVLFVDDKTGVIDVQMHPADPDTLLVATWERRRDGFDSHRGEPPVADGYDPYDPAVKWGPGGGLYKTTDGGRTFHKLSKGLPAVAMGRIGLSYYRKDPNVVFAVIDTEKIGLGTPPSPVFLGVQGEDAPGGGARLTAVTPDSPAGKAGLKAGDMLKTADKKDVKNYEQLTKEITSRKAGDKVVFGVLRGKETLEITATLANRPVPPAPPVPPPVDFRAEDTPEGVKVTRLPAEGPSAKAGLKVGDIIQMVGDKKVGTFKDITDLLSPRGVGSKFEVKVLRGKEVKELTLSLVPRPGGPFRSGRPYAFWYGGQRENVQEQQGPGGQNYGGVYKSTDGGETWARVNSVNPRPMYFSQIRVDPTDDKYVYVLGILLYRSVDGGKTFKMEGAEAVHPDQHALWIDPRDSRHMIIGCDGGFYASYDRGSKWDYLNSVAIGQFYHVAVDNRRPYRVYGGLQDNGSWGGPTHSLDGQGPINDDWYVVGYGDGFVCRVDANDPDLVYSESQDGHMGRVNIRTGERAGIRPRDVAGKPPYRFNWNTPFILSSHNSRIFYCGGNYVFRSLREGDDLRPISPEITRTSRGSATALAESPRNADVLWAGTDDGALWVTRDGGANWVNVSDKVGLPGPRWVASIEASRFADGRAYVAFDAHRSDDDNAYVYVTEDFGQTWKSIKANLPPGPTHVCREDVENPNLLYLGTEFAAWASLDRGGTWTKINNNLPTVAVHELAVHPTAGEVVAATHGRSLWVLDVTALRQMKQDTALAKVNLFRPGTATRWHSEPLRGTPYGGGNRRFQGENPPPGAQIYYSLSAKAQKIQLQILDYTGKPVRTLAVKNEPGLHRAGWDLVRDDAPPPGPGPFRRVRSLLPVTGTGLAAADQPSGPRRGPRPAQPGMYRVVLTVDDQTFTQSLRLENDPILKAPELIADEPQEPQKEERRPQRIDD